MIAGSDEQKFLEASLSYAAGKPILNDQEFDDLKMRLKVIYLYFVGLDNVFMILEFFLCVPVVKVGSRSHLGHG
jgi:hypothetical protein